MATPTFADEEKYLDKEGKPYVVQTLYWSCPVKFIPTSVWAFLQHRSFYEKHPSAPFPSLENVGPRYLQAESFFDIEYARYLTDAR